MSMSGPGEASTSFWTKTQLAACAVATGVLLTSGCEAGSAPPDDPRIVSVSPGRIPDAACNRPEPATPHEQQVTAANRCLSAMQAGRVALVDFGVAPSVTSAMRTDIVKILDKSTNGKIHVSVRVIPASAAAKKAFSQSIGDKGCVDTTKLKQYGSAMADEAMPEVHRDHFVVAVSNERACAPGVSGSSIGGRYVDVLLGGFSKHRERNALERGATINGAHELKHLYGSGHAGVVYAGEGGAATSLSLSLGDTLDLYSYLQHVQYREYGDTHDIMGEAPSIEYVQPNKVHQQGLNWPREVLKGPGVSLALQAGTAGVTLDKAAAAGGKFAVIQLPRPIQLTDTKTDKDTHSQAGTHLFDRLIALPLIGQDGKNYGFDLMLAKGYDVTASLGSIGAAPGETGTATVSIGGERYAFSVNSANSTVRRLA